MNPSEEELTGTEKFAQVERRIRSALVLSLRLSERARDEVIHFIDHDEYGLALATLLDAAAEEGCPINAAAGVEIDHAAALMSAPPGLWQLDAHELPTRLKESGLT